MTEKKPGEVNEQDKALAENLLICLGLAEREHELEKFAVETASVAFAAYREEIESRAKREGAREALERAAKLVDLLKTLHRIAPRPWIPGANVTYAEWIAVMKAVEDAISTYDPCKFPGCVRPTEGLPHKHTIELDLPRALADQPEAPAKADALSLGHPFHRNTVIHGMLYRDACNSCGQPEAAHGRKPE